jgi:hypothetical protein
LNAVERGLGDKIVQVRLKACDLFKEMLLDRTEGSVDVKDVHQVVGVLVDFLSENNSKIKEKCEDALKTMLLSSKMAFNEALVCILSKGSKMNKNVTRYNHCKLEFLVSIFSHPLLTESEDKTNNFPTALFLDFIDKGILMREKVLNRSLRDKVEKAFLIAYEKSNYEAIKDYLSHLDPTLIAKLSTRIPELTPPTSEKEAEVDPLKKQADDTNRRIIQFKKDKLKSIKMKHDNSLANIDISGIYNTDLEKEKTNKRSKISTTFETRNLSIDKIKKDNQPSAERSTQNLKDKISKNLDAIRLRNPKAGRSKVNDLNKDVHKRRSTNMKSRNKSEFERSKRELKTSLFIKRGTLNNDQELINPKIMKFMNNKNILEEEDKEPIPAKKMKSSLENY